MIDTDTNPVHRPERELVLERVIGTRPGLVFAAWIDPEQLTRWYCPRGFTLPFVEADVRRGGRYRICMRSPEGIDHWSSGEYREIADMHRLAFTQVWEDQSGRETLVTLTIEPYEGGTLVTLHQAPFATRSARDGQVEAWSSTLDHLQEHLAAGGAAAENRF